MKIFKIIILTSVLFTHFSIKNVLAQPTPAITASVNCSSLGSLKGKVKYQIEVTIKNNTADKRLVTYTVVFISGTTVKKRELFSTIVIPFEELTETNEGTMAENEWTLIKCKVECSSVKQ